MRKPTRPFAPTLEALETRDVPTQFGVPWANPDQLTLSFVPDGTATPTGPSSLSQTLAAAGPSAEWQREVLRAFQTWAVNTNVNIGVVADGGQPLGVRGAVQGDARFGDVRIAAAPAADDQLATGTPFSWTGTTFSGDVTFDADDLFGIGNSADAYDVFSVMIHEAGHVFGLDHSTTPGSVMAESYGFRTGLTADNVAAVQAMYGARTPDRYDAGSGNNTAASATALPSLLGLSQATATGDLTTLADADFYKVSFPLGAPSVVVRVVAGGTSLLAPSLTVYDSRGRTVATDVSTDPLNNDLLVRFPAGLLSTYTIKVDNATNDVFGVGGYQLVVDSLTSPLLAPQPLPVTPPAIDLHTNDTPLTATLLGGLLSPPTPDARFEAVYRAAIEDGWDTDYYAVRAPQADAGDAPMTLNVLAWATKVNGLDPLVRVYDAAGRPVTAQVLANDEGLTSVQVANVTPGAKYFLRVSAETAGSTGAYVVGADFNHLAPTTLDAVTAGTLDPGAVHTGALTLATGGTFHFLLGGGVTLEVVDGSGHVALSLTGADGRQPVSATAYLAGGTYTVRFRSATPRVAVAYDLSMQALSNPVGPYRPSSTSSGGTSSSTSTSSGYTYSSMSSTSSSGSSYSY